VILYINKQHFCKKIHRLVLQAFLPNPENRPQVNHINRIKSDNRLENLEWCSASENIIHSFKTGSRKISDLSGINHPQSILNNDSILEIRRLGNVMKGTDIAKMFGVHVSTIYNVLHNRNWNHII